MPNIPLSLPNIVWNYPFVFLAPISFALVGVLIVVYLLQSTELPMSDTSVFLTISSQGEHPWG